MLMVLFFFVFFFFHSPLSDSATVTVDGVSPWPNPNLHIGDSVVFQHRFHYNLYVFQTEEAFDLCNFLRATLLTKPNSSSYTWRTSRPGLFYFGFSNGSNVACLQGQKFSVKVVSAAPAPVPVPAPAIVAGGVVASSPAFPWPFQPRERTSRSPSPAPGSSLTAAVGPAAPDRGVPFINSNPAVPLPTGEVDSATIRPLPTSGCHRRDDQVVGFLEVVRALSCIILLVMMA
ncbi:early nodulin-like protein 1 [Andrographis paniculata]|uniref:early nodulin-like protein 1 n=1 Tax=Andrographis paniculata TaxID=175694 RepID=UPI0021E73A83|nr:early nodulin-like protein 1 [Andrographis paniculata]